MRRWPLLLAVLSQPVDASAPMLIDDFADSRGWEVRSFRGETAYSLVQDRERSVLLAECDDSASGLIWRREVDLTRTPFLHWSWRSSGPYAGLDERSKRGDDFVARIYVVRESTLMPWRSMAVNYVWSGSQPVGSLWANPYTDRARMIAVRSGSGADWVHEVRNVQADFRRAFDADVERVDVVALMSDCDDSGRQGRAWFDDIYFTSDAETGPRDEH